MPNVGSPDRASAPATSRNRNSGTEPGIGKQARIPDAQLLTRAVGARHPFLTNGGLQALAHNDGSPRPRLRAELPLGPLF